MHNILCTSSPWKTSTYKGGSRSIDRGWEQNQVAAVERSSSSISSPELIGDLCIIQVFAALYRREVVAYFDGRDITTEAGGLLLRETDRRPKLTGRLAACFTDHRQPDKIERIVQELVAQGCMVRAGIRS